MRIPFLSFLGVEDFGVPGVIFDGLIKDWLPSLLSRRARRNRLERLLKSGSSFPMTRLVLLSLLSAVDLGFEFCSALAWRTSDRALIFFWIFFKGFLIFGLRNRKNE